MLDLIVIGRGSLLGHAYTWHWEYDNSRVSGFDLASLADLDLTDGEFTNDIEEVELDEIELEIDSESKFKCTRAKFGIYFLSRLGFTLLLL